MKLAVVIAAYDEKENVEPLFRRLEATLGAMSEVDAEAIFVVEGTDGTREALAGLAADLEWVRVLYRETPSGLGAAFRRGFAAVPDDADYVVTLDADLNHQPEAIPGLLEAAIRRRADVLVGSRFVAGGRVEGTPAWKRLLSGGVNSLMHGLYGLDVRDKTSGFRIYRAEVLRRLTYDNDAFAFLPELLIGASRAGYRVVEEPIRFVFRREGRSKMDFWPTSWSYLTLLATRFDRFSLAVVALLLIGVAFRLALAFPAHKTPAESDVVLNGLCAFKVLRGETPVFVSYFRLGSLEAHLTALLTWLGGPSRATLLAGPVILGSLTMVVWYLFLREVLGRRAAALAMAFIAIPSPAFGFWTYMPNGYPQIVLACGAVLWLAAVARRRRQARWPVFAFGLAAGVGLWCSLQTLGCSVPAFLWLLLGRPRALMSRSFLPLVAGGFALGAAPWLAFNLLYELPSIRSNYATRPAPDLASAWSNARYLALYNLPELVANVEPSYWPEKARALRGLRFWVLAVHLAAASWLVYLLLRRRAAGGSPFGKAPWKNPLWIFALVIAAMCALNVVSAAGMTRGPTVRYVLPLYLVVPGLLALLVARLASRSRALAATLALSVVVFNLAGAYLPGTDERRRWSRRAAEDDHLVERLEREEIDVVLGNYWLVYPVNYYSNERVLGIPWMPTHDHYRVATRLEEGPLGWAVLAGAQEQRQLERWLADAGLAGEWLEVSQEVRLFVGRGRLPARDFLAPLRAAYHASRVGAHQALKSPLSKPSAKTMPGTVARLSAVRRNSGQGARPVALPEKSHA